MNQPGECDAVDGASLHLLPMRSGDTISPAVRPFQLLGRGQVAFSLSVLVWLAAAGGPGVRAQVGDNQPALSSGFLAAQGNASSTRLSAVSPPADAQGLLGLKEPPAGRQAVSLEDCLKRALGEAPDTRIAVERVVQQQAQLRRVWALLLPTLSTGIAYTHNCTGSATGIDCADRSQNLVNQDQIDQQGLLFQSLSDIVGVAADAAANPDDEVAFRQQQSALQTAADDIKNTDTLAVVVQPASQLTGQVNLNLPLFSPRAYPALMNAYDGVEASRLAELQARQGLALAVVRAYYAAFTAQRIVLVSERQLGAATSQRDAVKVRVDAATQPLLSLKRAELEVLRARQSLAQARAGADNAVAVLGTSLGMQEMFTLIEPGAVEVMDSADVNQLIDRAFAQRLELKTQRIAVAIAERSGLDAWMQFLPQVGLSATARATSFTQGFVRDPVTSTLILSATLPLYDGGVRYAALQESASQSTQERVKQQQGQDRIASQVRGNVRDVALRTEALGLSRQALQVVNEAHGQAQALFDAGVGTALDLIDSGLAVFAAETDELRAELDLDTARLGLRWATGSTLY